MRPQVQFIGVCEVEVRIVSPNFVRATNERQAYKLSKCEHHISQHTDIGSSREILKVVSTSEKDFENFNIDKN